MGPRSPYDCTKVSKCCGPNSKTSPPTSPSTPTSALDSLISAIASKKEGNTVNEHLLELQIKKEEFALHLTRIKAETAQLVYLQQTYKLRPSHIYPCKIYHNNVTWVCEFTGTKDAVGCGDSPSDAMVAFDNMWLGIQNAPVDG